MASFGSNIDDPEKHFLGDLLSDDDPSLPLNSPPRSGSIIPPAAVISGTGPVGGASSFWPEPPPPYSASLHMPMWSSTSPHSNINRVLTQPLKEPSQWDSLLMGGPPMDNGMYPGIHHGQPGAYHHQSPQHTLKPIMLPGSPPSSMSFSSVFTRDSESPETDLSPPQCPTPDARSNYSSSSRSNSSVTVSSTSRESRTKQVTPPPPEPIHKMPFSYRDVARGASSSSQTNQHHQAGQRNSAPVSANTSPPLKQKQRIGSASSAMTDCVPNNNRNNDNNYSNGNGGGNQGEQDDKKRKGPESEFQKITRKKGAAVMKAEKVPSAIVSPVLPEVVNGVAPVVDAPSRWDVLKTLSPRRGNSNSEGDDMEANKNDAASETHPLTSSNNPSASRRASQCSSVEGDHPNGEEKAAPKRSKETQKKKAELALQNKKQQKANKRKSENVVFVYITILFTIACGYLETFFRWVFHLICDVAYLLLELSRYYFCSTCMNITIYGRRSYMHCWNYCSGFLTRLRHMDWNRYWKGAPPDDYGRWGLLQNIDMPSTGDEAVSRLIRCQGQDAYVILGLRADCTDDDIKRYYKKQSLLIHPDKNPSEYAEEAFQVLKKAYDMIGHPDDRKKYNIANIDKNPMHAELEELWEKLRARVEEARSTMHCDCGKRHMRVLQETVKQSEARWCNKCRVRHPAKQNDIWAESRFFGFVWMYYTCVEGQIYDISQWAACERNQLKHLRPDSHLVQYRLVSSVPPQMMGSLGKFPNSLLSSLQREVAAIREDARAVLDTTQSISFRPPERGDADRPRKANNRMKRKR